MPPDTAIASTGPTPRRIQFYAQVAELDPIRDIAPIPRHQVNVHVNARVDVELGEGQEPPSFRLLDDGGGPATRVAVRAGELAPRELDRSALGPTAVLLGVAGNFPQAFSHIGLITAANAIDKAREGAA